MSNPLVRCIVDQCAHYLPGDQCTAAKISVYNNDDSVSETSSDTKCQAFRHRQGIGDMVSSLANSNFGGALAAAFLPGQQMTPTVECFVQDCRYWDAGNACLARSIEVTGFNASTDSDTDCETFVPR